MISGIVIVLLMLCFGGIVYWAWTARNHARFEEAANLPLHDEGAACCCQEQKK